MSVEGRGSKSAGDHSRRDLRTPPGRGACQTAASSCVALDPLTRTFTRKRTSATELALAGTALPWIGSRCTETHRPRDAMKAIIQAKYGLPDVLNFKDIEKPIVKDDQVLVRVHSAAVNIGDWHLLRGVPYVMRIATGLLKPRHEVPGLDVAGEIEAVGRDVTELRAGEEVFGWCKGAFAGYACAGENNFLPKPDNLTLEQSAAVGDSAFTALNAVRDQGKVQSGHKVLINGASGGVGTFAVQVAKSFGADVTGVCSTKNAD